MLPCKIAASKFQLNTHAIGDSANTVILKIFTAALAGTKEDGKLRHAQVLREVDFDYFKFRIIPWYSSCYNQICIGLKH
jgi:predicted amidohydrolase YtcJ